MTRNVRLHLDQFGQEALRRFAGEREDSTESVLRTAALYYLADRELNRPGWRVPRFARDTARPQVVELGLDDDIWDALLREAERQGVEPELLVEHAVLYYLADLDSGRLAGRLSEAIDQDEPPL